MQFSTSLWRVLVTAFYFVPVSAQAAGPGPDATAQPRAYDVALMSRLLDHYDGEFVFQRVPDQLEETTSGALSVTLATDESTGVTAQGTWWSWEFWFFCFWFASADMDTDGQLYVLGVAWGDHVFGKAGLTGTLDLEPGRYRLLGRVAEQTDGEPSDSEPSDSEPSDSEPSDSEPSDSEPTDGEPTDDEPIVIERS